jgi:hypothetical protein
MVKEADKRVVEIMICKKETKKCFYGMTGVKAVSTSANIIQTGECLCEWILTSLCSSWAIGRQILAKKNTMKVIALQVLWNWKAKKMWTPIKKGEKTLEA